MTPADRLGAMAEEQADRAAGLRSTAASIERSLVEGLNERVRGWRCGKIADVLATAQEHDNNAQALRDAIAALELVEKG